MTLLIKLPQSVESSGVKFKFVILNDAINGESQILQDQRIILLDYRGIHLKITPVI